MVAVFAVTSIAAADNDDGKGDDDGNDAVCIHSRMNTNQSLVIRGVAFPVMNMSMERRSINLH